ncbi:Hpt domain-containing protein [uncultured Polaribacter sp.]|uniref:Hpt domain-containing protein n=1 Tax=uncultured Polaribacter sp. TaxID=174711 RepID=UPI00262D2229|nr:Hpt domain-containing protein [uncultured Polaribacter sp.]
MNIQSILISDIVNLTSIKEYFSSDKNLLIQLIEVFISDTSPRLETLKKSLESVNYEELKSISHFLKSSLALMGVSCIEEIKDLEKSAEEKVSEEEIKTKINLIFPILEKSLLEYQSILDNLKVLN